MNSLVPFLPVPQGQTGLRLALRRCDLGRNRESIRVESSLYIARNAVFYCLLVKANNAKFSCQLLLLFCGRFERSGVQASCRVPNSIYQTHWPSHRCSGAGGAFISRRRCVSVVTQRDMWTPLSKKTSKMSFLNRARWSRRPLLVICTVVNNEKKKNWRSLPDLGLLTKSKVDERLDMFVRRHSNRLSSTLEQRRTISSALVLHFFLSAVNITKQLGENDDVF